mmetsp:Transcript_25687/g.62416  ORF Transcript_25687/g.62416 Transcript_25687/m.62416 type:complete len:268 (+) Transcript_25687:471-1274(+)
MSRVTRNPQCLLGKRPYGRCLSSGSARRCAPPSRRVPAPGRRRPRVAPVFPRVPSLALVLPRWTPVLPRYPTVRHTSVPTVLSRRPRPCRRGYRAGLLQWTGCAILPSAIATPHRSFGAIERVVTRIVGTLHRGVLYTPPLPPPQHIPPREAEQRCQHKHPPNSSCKPHRVPRLLGAQRPSALDPLHQPSLATLVLPPICGGVWERKLPLTHRNPPQTQPSPRSGHRPRLHPPLLWLERVVVGSQSGEPNNFAMRGGGMIGRQEWCS